MEVTHPRSIGSCPRLRFYLLVTFKNSNSEFCSNISTEQMLYTESDLEASMDKIETLNFHEEKDVFGIKFWAYNAGHVLGAAMFMIEIAGVKVPTINLIQKYLSNSS